MNHPTKADSDERDLSELLGHKPETSFTDRATVHIHEFYIVGEIKGAEEYTEWFDKIRHASPLDQVKLYINSGGGDLWTAVQFMRVLRETPAHVIASVEGECMSAATILFLQAKEHEVSPHSMFMFHNYSGGVYGKGGEVAAQVEHQKVWSTKLMHEIYKDFLSKKEIDAILANKDLWMTGEEVVTRLGKKNLTKRSG